METYTGIKEVPKDDVLKHANAHKCYEPYTFYKCDCGYQESVEL